MPGERRRVERALRLAEETFGLLAQIKRGEDVPPTQPSPPLPPQAQAPMHRAVPATGSPKSAVPQPPWREPPVAESQPRNYEQAAARVGRELALPLQSYSRPASAFDWWSSPDVAVPELPDIPAGGLTPKAPFGRRPDVPEGFHRRAQTRRASGVSAHGQQRGDEAAAYEDPFAESPPRTARYPGSGGVIAALFGPRSDDARDLPLPERYGDFVYFDGEVWQQGGDVTPYPLWLPTETSTETHRDR